MFLGWVYGKWERGKNPSGLSRNGEYKRDYMDKYMPLMINAAITNNSLSFMLYETMGW